ncbi:hypothetical protein GCM10007885_43940 [Methylobacterium gnaphalii]|nr:hypothetical protein GCM10007885_43940 [Methylobacterium gnaphalii]
MSARPIPARGSRPSRFTCSWPPYHDTDREASGGAAEGEHENIKLVEMPLADLAGMAATGQLRDLKTLALVLTLQARHGRLFTSDGRSEID